MADAILIVSFGGPEKNEDVMPFLENVTRGRGVPRERLLEVADHYYHFGGKSPINDQNRELIAELNALLDAEGPRLPVYWGNRNWEPYFAETFRRMKEDGITRVFAFTTSAFSSYSGCRQYRENLQQAQAETNSAEIEVLKLRVFFNHPGFLAPFIEGAQTALADFAGRKTKLLFTAHSVPLSMAPDQRYVPQLREASRLVAEAVAHADYELVYQSRSGPPAQPWLEPDICERLRQLAGDYEAVVVVPIGFVSDHLEVLYDLDTEAKDLAAQLGLGFARVATPGTHPSFVRMVRDLVVERRDQAAERPALGVLGACHDVCPVDCCPAPAARPRPVH